MSISLALTDSMPWHRVERLDNIVNWFDKYLQGKPMPQYDVPSEQSIKTEKQQKHNKEHDSGN